MIIDVPTATDFTDNGLAFLNLAWESVTALTSRYFEAREYHEDIDLEDEHKAEIEEERREIEESYWRQSQPALAIAVALAHQGGEFLLKARIAAVSPFLLISPDRWPGGGEKTDKSFADFKTVDAQDLVKIHDTVCPVRLSEAFKQTIENLRVLRNTVMHSVDKRKPFIPRDCVVAILEIAQTLMGDRSWQSLRSSYDNAQTDVYYPYSNDKLNPTYPLAKETMHVINDLLTTAEALRFYGFNKRQRKYLCTHCHEVYADDFVWSVQLESKTSSAIKASCVCCQRTGDVRREKCGQDDCEGNVLGLDIYDETWTCLTCNKSQYCEDDDGERDYYNATGHLKGELKIINEVMKPQIPPNGAL